MVKQKPEQKKLPFPKKPVPVIIIHNKNFFRWLISSFMVCGCMFVLGILVGRNTAPVQFDVDSLEKKLINLQDSVLKKEKQRIAVDDFEADPAPFIEPVDIIDTLKDKGKKPQVYEQYVPPVLTPKYAKTPPSKEQVKLAKSEPEPKKKTIRSTPVKKSEPVIKKKATAEVEKKIKAPPEQKKPGTGFAIQVASLKNQQKAKSLTKTFKKKGYPAFCQSLTINGEMWHRVRIGPYPDRSLAEKDQHRLKAAGVDSIVSSVDR
jgi:cell division septation protein DedD